MEPWLPTLELALAATAAALWYLQGGWVWYRGPWPGPWPLLLLAAMISLTLARKGLSALRPSAFTLPLIVFLASAAVSLWAAYSIQIGLAKAWLIVASVGLYWALAQQPDEARLTFALGFWALFAIGLTAYFLITTDWEALPIKIPVLTRLGAAIASQLPSVDVHRISPNVTGGMLAVVLPFTVPLLTVWRRPIVGLPRAIGLLLAVLGTLALGVGLLGLLVTVSRGAWMGLSGAAVLWIYWRLLEPLGTRRLPAFAATLLAGGLLTGGAGWALMAGRLPESLTAVLHPPIANRLRLLNLSAMLLRDTPFTGIGLGMYEMHLSIYTLLIHVGYIVHSHNMLLDIAIEQGILGAAAFVTLALSVFAQCPTISLQGRESRVEDPESHSIQANVGRGRLICEAALASLTALLLHGLVDDTAYGSRALLLLFVPFGILAAAQQLQSPSWSGVSRVRLRKIARAQMIALLGLTGVGICGVLGLRGDVQGVSPLGWLAAWRSNLGAVAQARVELNTYDQYRFGELTMDQVRYREDLREAEAHFEHALELDPHNATARHRLTAIALARNSYVEALAHMQTLWDAGHRDRVTRLLYGDALVAAGRPEEAADVVRGLMFARARLLGQHWSRYHLGGDTDRAGWAAYAANLLDGSE